MTQQRPKKLLAQVREAIRLKHHSIRTEEAHVAWTRRWKGSRSVPTTTVVRGQDIPEGFTAILAGHIHRTQMVRERERQ